MNTLRLERHENANWGAVVVPYKSKTYKFPCHIPTREIYNFDPDPLIRFKCTALTVATPVLSVMRSVYWLAKAAFMVIAEAFRYLDEQTTSEEAWDAIAKTAYDSVRALGYSTMMTGYAFCGIFAPYWGRQHYGHLEKALNRHTDGTHRDKFYLAKCFQPLYILPKNLNCDPAKDKLYKYLDNVYAMKAAICDKPLKYFDLTSRVPRPAT